MGWGLAVVIHELGHYFAVLLCGGKVLSLSAIPGGVDMVVSPMNKGQRFLCILCGPFLGITPVLFRNYFPELAVFSFLLTIYNLIPVRPLDGGRLLELFIGEYEKPFRILERLIMWVIVALCIGLSMIYHLGVLPMVVAAELVMKNRKMTCKRGAGAVQ